MADSEHTEVHRPRRPRPAHPPAPRACPSCGRPLSSTPIALCGLAVLGVAVGLLVVGPWPAGVALIVIELVACVLLVPSAPRDLGALGGHLSADARGRARLAWVWATAWWRATRELLRARRRQQRLHSARRQRVAALGDAVVHGDYARAASVKAETRRLGAEIQAHDREAEEAIRLAREQVERERESREKRPLQALSNRER